MGVPIAKFVAPALGAALFASLSCVDLTHENQVQALGQEAPGIPVGPLHRPGQPCLVCHGGSGPANLQLSIGGTVTMTQGMTGPAVGAQVLMEDITGSSVTLTTNDIGNFYVPVQAWQPKYPLQVTTVSLGMNTQGMTTNIGREGSCADCHQPTPSQTSPGPVFVVLGM